MGQERSRTKEVLGGFGAVLEVEMERALTAGREGRSVVLVEGASDQRAIETLARRRGRRLVDEGVEVIATAGITNLPRFLDLLGPGGHDVRLAGMSDQQEQTQLRRALESVGIVAVGAELEPSGFFTCVRDLEDELVRALGPDRMLALIERHGHSRRFRSFQNQPAQSHKRIEDQIWRWLGNFKISYASLMVEDLELDRVPPALDGVLAAVR